MCDNSHPITDMNQCELDSHKKDSKKAEPQQDEEDECWDDARQDQDGDGNQDESLDLTLHKAVFEDDYEKIFEILSNKKRARAIINNKDKHGNTALHLACMLGRTRQMVEPLIHAGAGVDIKNLKRWTPFHEACSYGNRDIISLMTKTLKDDVYVVLSKTKLAEKLEKTRNYRLVLKWEFQSWIPLVARVLPNDTCVITKHGRNVRIDTSLLDIELLSWKRGECSLLYSEKYSKKWAVMNNKTRKYKYFETKIIDNVDVATKVDGFMSGDILDLEIKFSDIQLTRTTSGWIWKADKIERVGKYNTALYSFNNVFLITRKRREHLTDEEVRINKSALKCFKKILKTGEKPIEDAEYEVEDDDTTNLENFSKRRHRESLPPPPPTNVTWEQYYQAEPGEFPNLGRPQKCKITKTPVKASVAMSEEFPLTKNEFLDLLSIVPLKAFKKLKDFIEMRLPEGFPVRLDIPIYSFLAARITFEEFTFIDGPVDDLLFSIPTDYEEDPRLFRFLSSDESDPENEA